MYLSPEPVREAANNHMPSHQQLKNLIRVHETPDTPFFKVDAPETPGFIQASSTRSFQELSPIKMTHESDAENIIYKPKTE